MIRLMLPSVLAAGLLAAGPARADDKENAAELKKLEGNWKLTREERRGHLRPTAERGKESVFFEEGRIKWLGPATKTGDVSVNAAADPKEIDVEVTRGSTIGKKLLGIYKIEGDKLTICWGEPDEKRPKKFITKTAVGAGEWLATYQRVKDDSAAAEKPEKGGKPAGSSTRPAEDTKKDDAANAELKKLEGNWRLTREEQRGNLRALIEQKKPGVFFEDGKIQWTSAYMGHGGARGDVAANPAAEPKEIDVEITRGSGLGKKVLGIYKIAGDKLTICWGELDGKRPKKFVTTTAIGAGEYLQTFQRVKDDADTAGSKPKPAEGATKENTGGAERSEEHTSEL